MAKTIFITGATAGIGRATAELFAKNGWNIIATGRRKEKLADLVSLISSADKSVSIDTLCFDVRDKSACEKAIASLNGKRVDLLLNNAGLARGRDKIQDGDTDDWEEMIDTNIKGLLFMTRLILPQMVTRGEGHIINVGSVAGKEVYEGGNVYHATKFAVDALTRAMRIDLIGTGIKVGSICPGLVETEFAVVRFKGDLTKSKKIYEGFVPLVAEDIADAIHFMASRPDHVNIADMLVFPKAQASGSIVYRG